MQEGCINFQSFYPIFTMFLFPKTALCNNLLLFIVYSICLIVSEKMLKRLKNESGNEWGFLLYCSHFWIPELSNSAWCDVQCKQDLHNLYVVEITVCFCQAYGWISLSRKPGHHPYSRWFLVFLQVMKIFLPSLAV